MKFIYTVQSKSNFYQRFSILQYVIEQGEAPINPHSNFGYNLYELCGKEQVLEAQNYLLGRADELWVFGIIDLEVEKAIAKANEMSKPVKYFSVESTARGIKPIFKDEVEYDTKSDSR